MQIEGEGKDGGQDSCFFQLTRLRTEESNNVHTDTDKPLKKQQQSKPWD